MTSPANPAPSGTGFQPRDPLFRDRVMDSFARQGAMSLLGANIHALEPGRCQIHLPYREDLSQQHGFFHGGLLTTVADTAAGYAAFSLASPDTTVLSVEFKVNFLAPARGELVIATGEVVRSGRTLTIAQAQVHVEHQGERVLCATMLQTIMNVTGHSERA